MPQMQEQTEIGTESADDMILLLEKMKQMNLPDLLDQHIKRHGGEESNFTGRKIVTYNSWANAQ